MTTKTPTPIIGLIEFDNALKQKLLKLDNSDYGRGEHDSIVATKTCINCLRNQPDFMRYRNDKNTCNSNYTDINEKKWNELTWKQLFNEIFKNDNMYLGEESKSKMLKKNTRETGGNRNKRKRTIKKSIKKNKKSRRNMKQYNSDI